MVGFLVYDKHNQTDKKSSNRKSTSKKAYNLNCELTNIYHVVGQENILVKIPLNYVPGELTLTNEIWKAINSDTSRKFSLHFDYNTYSKDRHNVADFYVDLSREQSQKPYLILNIYDFRDKKV